MNLKHAWRALVELIPKTKYPYKKDGPIKISTPDEYETKLIRKLPEEVPIPQISEKDVDILCICEEKMKSK